MDYVSHTIGGVALGAGAVYLCNQVGVQVNPLFIVGASAAGALLPDIDHPKSYVGSKVRLISDILYSTVGHRTITHSLLFMGIVGLLFAMFNVQVGIGIALGILSHIMLDMLTPQGVAYLYPWNKKRIKLIK